MTLLKNAMYNVLLRKQNVCCLCFETVETNAIRIDDGVFLNENGVSNIVQLSEILAFIFGSGVGDLASETVCKQCATSALNCYIFTKKCKENSQNFQQAIESLNNCLQNAIKPERIQLCKSLFVSLDAGYAVKEYYDSKRCVNKQSLILKRFSSISREAHANFYLQNIKNEDDFDADFEVPMVQEATKFKCKTLFRDLILHKDSKPLAYKCKICLKTFKIYNTLRQHYAKQHSPKIFKCSKCECSYKSFKLLETHLKNCRTTMDLILHKNSKPLAYKCKTCLKTFKVYDSLKHHYLRIHAPKPFKCSKCERSYKSFEVLKKHLKTCGGKAPIPGDPILHEDSKPLAYKCNSCLKTFKDLKTLRQHYLRIHVPKSFKCSKCERSYGSLKFLETHLKTCSGPVPNPRDLILHEDSEPLAYKCKSCLRTFKEFKNLKHHYFCAHAPKKFKCSKCKRSYGSYNLLQAHLKISHLTCVCAECGKTFSHQFSLKRHELEHRVPLRLVCQKCGRVYKDQRSLRNHTVSGVCQRASRKSTNEGTLQCDTCNKVFSLKSSLRTHIRSIHRDTSSPFDCTWCGKKFTCQSRLKDHLPKHTQEKNFPCEICGNRFVNKMSLLYHTRIHTGEKPYECSSCGEKFVNSSRRADHYRRQHTDETVSCDACSAEFKCRRNLRKHKLRHCNPQSKLVNPFPGPTDLDLFPKK